LYLLFDVSSMTNTILDFKKLGSQRGYYKKKYLIQFPDLTTKYYENIAHAPLREIYSSSSSSKGLIRKWKKEFLQDCASYQGYYGILSFEQAQKEQKKEAS
jgi:hypothetical protein